MVGILDSILECLSELLSSLGGSGLISVFIISFSLIIGFIWILHLVGYVFRRN